MISIMSVKAPYFFSLASILLSRKGTQDPFGLTYSDNRTEIRGTPDGATMQVRNKGIASNVPDMVVASRGPGGETFERQHSILAHHLQWQASRCFEGPHVFAFKVEGKDGAVSELEVLATGLEDAVRHVEKAGRGEILDIAKAVHQDEAGAHGIDLGSVERTESLDHARDLARCIEEARGVEDQVYVFTLQAKETTPAQGRGRDMPPIRAMNLSDAERMACHTGIPSDMRIVKVEIQTLLEFYAGRGSSHAVRQGLLVSSEVSERNFHRR